MKYDCFDWLECVNKLLILVLKMQNRKGTHWGSGEQKAH